MAMTTQELWTIVAVAADGDEARLEERPQSSLHHLLVQAVHKLYGTTSADPDEYEILIGGAPQTNLEVSLEHAGLHNDSEVVVQAKDVSKG